MKQYTNESQTAKLIKLGFEEPKGLADAEPSSGKWVRPAYSIGELIEMLEDTPDIEICRYNQEWRIDAAYLFASNQELIDALVNMAEQLKEEGVI